MRQLALTLASAPAPTFENFVAGRNGEAKASLHALASGVARERFVYLWGPPASGRTHLLKAMVEGLATAGARAAYVACTKRTSFPAVDEFDCLAADDVHELDADGQIALFHLYNTLRERDGALVATGSAAPMQLGLRADLVTRLGWGLVFQIHALTDSEKAEALDTHARARGFALSREMCDYLLHRVQRDMPSLLAVLEALDRYSLEMKRPVTLSLLRELLRQVSARSVSRER